MAKIKNIDTSIKATIISDKCHIPCACIDDKDTSIKGSIITPIQDATTVKKGIVRLATEQEAIDGERDDNVVITPYTLKQATHYIYEQAIANDIWVIEHNLNKNPTIDVVDSSGHVQIPDEIIYNNKNQITVYFISPFAGYAYLN